MEESERRRLRIAEASMSFVSAARESLVKLLSRAPDSAAPSPSLDDSLDLIFSRLRRGRKPEQERPAEFSTPACLRDKVAEISGMGERESSRVVALWRELYDLRTRGVCPPESIETLSSRLRVMDDDVASDDVADDGLIFKRRCVSDVLDEIFESPRTKRARRSDVQEEEFVRQPPQKRTHLMSDSRKDT